MKEGRLFLAIFKALLCMGGLFFIGYLGYHYPDAMVWVIAAAILCAFSWYFYTKGQDD
jgi:hypothetical protein